MNRRGFFKTVFAGLALFFLPEVSKPTPGYGQVSVTVPGTRKADFPPSDVTWWSHKENLGDEELYFLNTNHINLKHMPRRRMEQYGWWRPNRMGIITNIEEPS